MCLGFFSTFERVVAGDVAGCDLTRSFRGAAAVWTDSDGRGGGGADIWRGGVAGAGGSADCVADDDWLRAVFGSGGRAGRLQLRLRAGTPRLVSLGRRVWQARPSRWPALAPVNRHYCTGLEIYNFT